MLSFIKFSKLKQLGQNSCLKISPQFVLQAKRGLIEAPPNWEQRMKEEEDKFYAPEPIKAELRFSFGTKENDLMRKKENKIPGTIAGKGKVIPIKLNYGEVHSYTQKIGGFARRQYYMFIKGEKILCDPTLLSWNPKTNKITAVHFRVADEVIEYKRPSFGDPTGRKRPPLPPPDWKEPEIPLPKEGAAVGDKKGGGAQEVKKDDKKVEQKKDAKPAAKK